MTGGLINIEAIQYTNDIVIRFQDNGRGIPEDQYDKVFEPFFTTKRGEGYSGLGLNIVYNLVTIIFNGEIYCSKTEGGGTTFVIKIPVE